MAQKSSLGAKLLLAGVALGALGSWVTGHAMQGVLVDVSFARVEIFAFTAVAMGVVVLLASLLPSRRAARVSPMEALRAE